MGFISKQGSATWNSHSPARPGIPAGLQPNQSGTPAKLCIHFIKNDALHISPSLFPAHTAADRRQNMVMNMHC